MKTREIRGKTHALVVLRVTDWDAQGRPSKAEIKYDDSTIDLRNDDESREFVTAYIPEVVTKTKMRVDH